MQLSKIIGYKGIYQLNNYFTKGILMPGLGYKTYLQHVCKTIHYISMPSFIIHVRYLINFCNNKTFSLRLLIFSFVSSNMIFFLKSFFWIKFVSSYSSHQSVVSASQPGGILLLNSLPPPSLHLS